MVFFSCDGCGDMLKKSQVDNHANRCRQCDSVSCVDCSVSFYGDDYRAHTSCITEVERYEKRAPTKKNGKVSPQQQWMDLIQSSVEAAPSHLRHHFQVMAGLDNVPRKEKQFRNFTTNSLNLRGQRNAETVVTDIWNFLKELREKQKAERTEAEAKEKELKEKETENCSKNTEPLIKNCSNEKKSSAYDSKSVKKAMKKVLKKSKDKSLSIKHLRKAVQQHLGAPSSSKSEIKELVQLNVKSAKKQTFIVDGMLVSLKVE